MAIALITATLVHVIWLHRCYRHLDPRITSKIRAATGFLSWLLTASLLVLVQQALHDGDFHEIYLQGSSGSRQVIGVIASPDKSACYAEIRDLPDSER